MAIEHIFNKDPVPLYIGFEDIDSDLRSANEELYREDFDPKLFPVHNIYTKDGKYHVVMHVPGFKKEEIEVKIQGDLMTVSGKRADLFAEMKIVYAGLNSPVDFHKNYRLADDLDLESISYEDGVLTVTLFKVVLKERAGDYSVNYRKGDPKPAKVSKKSDAEGSMAGPANNVSIVSDEPTKSAVVEVPATSTTPQVEVVIPAELPQIVEVKVDPTSTPEEPKIILKDASIEVKDNTSLVVVPTEAGKSDIVVSIPSEVEKKLENMGIDVVKTIEAAVEQTEVVPELPKVIVEDPPVVIDVMVTDDANKPKIEITVPETLTQIMEVVQDENHSSGVPSVTLTDTSEKIPENAELVPIVTPEGQPDIVVAVVPEVKEVLETKGIDITEVVEEAIAKVDPQVETIIPVEVPPSLPEVKEVAPVIVDVAPIVPEPVAEPVVVNAEIETKPTVEVTPLDPMPQVVTIETTTPVNSDTDVAIVMTDSTHEVADNVELIKVPTEEGKSDVVVAVTPEIKAELEEKKVDIVEVVSEAIKEVEVAPVLPEPTIDMNTSVVVTNSQNGQAMAEVSLPVEPTQVMEVKIENPDNIIPKIVVTDVSEKIPENVELKPVVTPEGQPDAVIAVSPEVAETLGSKGIDPVVAIEDAMKKIDSEITTVVDPAPSAGETSTPVVVEVTSLDPMPQVVSMEIAPNAANTAEIGVVLKDATVEVPDNVELVTVPTEAGKSDVVVAVTPEVKEQLTEIGVKAEEVVASALETAAAPELPKFEEVPILNVEVVNETGEPKLAVEIPEVVPSVVKVELAPTDAANAVPSVVISDTSEKIPENAELVPIVTKEGQPDIIVAVTPEVKETLENAGVDVAKDIGAAVVEASIEVAPIVATEVPVANNG